MARRWLVPGGVALVALAVTARWWGPWLWGVLGIHGERLQSLQALIEIGLGLAAAAAFVFRWWRPRPPLAAVEPPPPQSAIPPSTDHRRRYLECVVRQTEYLALSGVDPAVKARGERETRLRLAAVYTGLLTQSSEEPAEWRNLRPEGPRRQAAVALLEHHHRLVLLGDPGSGKSTFVAVAALALAGAALRDGRAGLELLTAPLPQPDGRDEDHPQPWTHGPLLPVRVVLRDLAAHGLPAAGERAEASHLWSFIRSRLAADGLDGYFDELKAELCNRGGLLLLDGLDEVPEAKRCREQIRAMVAKFAASCGHCRILVTSRPYAYQNQEWRLPGFAEATLAEWHEGQIRRFVQSWYREAAAHGRYNEADAAGRGALLERAIFTNPRLLELARRPLLLALIASLHAWQGGSLPEGRGELYENTVKLLLEFWEMERVERDDKGEPVLAQPSLTEYLQVSREKVRQALEDLAYEAHAEQPGAGEVTDGGGTADVPEGVLLSRLMRLRQDANPAHLLEFLRDRLGLLVPRGNEVYTFPHRTLQEYLAACHLVRGEYPDNLVKLVRKAPGRWREVVLLAAARSAELGPFALRLLVETLLEGEPAGDEPAAEPWCVFLAGQAVAERAEVGADIAAVRQVERLRPRFVRLLGDSRLPAVDRARAGAALSRWVDPRPEVTTVDGIELCDVPAGSFRMGSEQGDQEAFSWEKPVHDCEIPYAYRLSRYPVTVAQFREFVESAGFKPAHAGWQRGGANEPVVMVSWDEAMVFCEWLTARWRQSGKIGAEDRVTLPSEAEWEKGARGTDGRKYPWGEDADPERANFDRTGIGGVSAVGCFPAGRSPYGCEEMAGNVWEWTRSAWGKKFGEPEFGYPYVSSDGREEVSSKMLRVLRGGSCFYDSGFVRCASRHGGSPDTRVDHYGFRVALLPFSSDL